MKNDELNLIGIVAILLATDRDTVGRAPVIQTLPFGCRAYPKIGADRKQIE